MLSFMHFSKHEIKELAKAWIVISLAFTILYTGISFTAAAGIIFVIAALTAGVGFLLHEIAHKYFAQKYHCQAEFVADNKMLLLAVVFSFFGFLFAAPGAVYIRGHITRKQNGIISLAGPATNMLLALVVFLPLTLSGLPILSLIGRYGFYINAFIGLFNLIPFGMFDGRKILAWNKTAYGIIVAVGVLLLIINTGL